MKIVIQPYICYSVCNLYKRRLSYISSDCNGFHIKFPDYLDMQVYSITFAEGCAWQFVTIALASGAYR